MSLTNKVTIMRKIAALFLFIFISSNSFATEPPASFADLVEKLTPAVVNISTTQKVKGGIPGIQMFEMPNGQMPEEFRDFFENFANPEGRQIEREVYSLGSGFIIDEAGYIATNNHVIADAEEVTVTLSDNTKLKAKIIGRDVKTDLALLKVEAGKKLPFVPLGDSDVSRVGDWVIAIGNPFGLGGTVTAGIISARSRNINAGPFDDFIQTDAAINKGNSGGPLFNTHGQVIGINTAILSPSGTNVGIGFAIPMAMAKPVLMQLKSGGKIERAWLGVKLQQVSEEIAESVGLSKPIGALVMEVAKGSPSDKAGIEVGDIITNFDGKEVKEMRNLPRMVAETPIGKTVEIEVYRKGVSKNLQVTLGELKEKLANKGNDEQENLDSSDAKEVLGMVLSADEKGVVISRTKPDSIARRRGLQAGDVIVQVGNEVVKTPTEVNNAVSIAKKAGRKFVLIRLLRGHNEILFLTLPIG